MLETMRAAPKAKANSGPDKASLAGLHLDEVGT